MLNRLRRRFDAAIRRRIDDRFEEIRKELGRVQADYDARLSGTQADFSYVRSEFDRIAPQVSALEQRFEWLRHQFEAGVQGTADGTVDLARVEHERARLRLELASHYEERLRRLEAEFGA